MDITWTSIIGLTALALSSRHVMGPIVIHTRNSYPLNRSFTELPVEYPLIHLPPTFPQKLYELENLGFSLVGHLGMGEDQTKVSGVISVLVNREARTFAAVAALFASSPTPRIASHYVEFITDFADGFQVNTANSPTVGVFFPMPERRGVRVPHLRHASTLYDVHRYLVGLERERVPVLPPPGQELKHAREAFAKAMKRQHELGYFYFDEAVQRYRPTWQAAIRSTWRLSWPAKPLIQRRQDRAGRRLAQDAGVRF